MATTIYLLQGNKCKWYDRNGNKLRRGKYLLDKVKHVIITTTRVYSYRWFVREYVANNELRATLDEVTPLAKPLSVKNLYVRTVSMGNRKSCPTCKEKLMQGEHIWSIGEYIYGKWNTVELCCALCWCDIMLRGIRVYEKSEHRQVQLIGYQGVVLPSWMHT